MITLKTLKNIWGNIWQENNITIIIYDETGNLYEGDLMQLTGDLLNRTIDNIYNNYDDDNTIEIEII